MAQPFTGEEYLLNSYHAQAVFLTLSGALLRLWRQPAPAYLDLAAIGIAAMIACGRIGCLTAGCCHGRPLRWGARHGVCYGPDHVAEGLELYLAGVRLFPTQALGVAGGLLIATVGVLLVLGDLIAQLRHPDATPQILRGQQDGVFHVLFPDAAATESPPR